MTTRVFLQGLFMLALGAFIFSPSCTKVQHSGQWPQLLGPGQVDSAYWTAAKVEQIARQKADSMNIVDSLARANGSVDTNSLVNKKNIMVAYVEVNNFTIENAGCYVDENGRNVFDLCYIFAPNINLDNTTGKPTLQYNSQVAAMFEQWRCTGYTGQGGEGGYVDTREPRRCGFPELPEPGRSNGLCADRGGCGASLRPGCSRL